jgi:hypothetical protein
MISMETPADAGRSANLSGAGDESLAQASGRMSQNHVSVV